MNAIEPKMMEILQKMEMNNTPLEISLAGLDLKQAKCGIFSKWLGICTSLLSVDMSRMGLDDE